jgi:hypothetical protein
LQVKRNKVCVASAISSLYEELLPVNYLFACFLIFGLFVWGGLTVCFLFFCLFGLFLDFFETVAAM